MIYQIIAINILINLKTHFKITNQTQKLHLFCTQIELIKFEGRPNDPSRWLDLNSIGNEHTHAYKCHYSGRIESNDEHSCQNSCPPPSSSDTVLATISNIYRNHWCHGDDGHMFDSAAHAVGNRTTHHPVC